MSISFSKLTRLRADPRVLLAYPDRRLVSEEWIMCRWDDAVSNGEIEPRDTEPTLAEAIHDLEDVGHITVDTRV
jgi:hypothetical protein